MKAYQIVYSYEQDFLILFIGTPKQVNAWVMKYPFGCIVGDIQYI